MNFAEQLNRFYVDLGHPDTNRWPVAIVTAFFDEAERKINRIAETVRSSSIENSVSDTPLYDLPSDLVNWKIDSVYYSTTDQTERKRLVPITIEELDAGDRLWRTRYGDPVNWYFDREQNQWGVYPVELSVGIGTNCIEILYRGAHTKMTRYYTAEIVSINNGSPNATGSGTVFVGNVLEGDAFGIGKLLDRDTDFPTEWYDVSANPLTDTALVLTTNFAEANVAAGDYICCSPSSIVNDELNMCAVLWAQSLTMTQKGELQRRKDLQGEAIGRAEVEAASLRKDSASLQPMVPQGRVRSGTTREATDYGFSRRRGR